MEKKYYRISEIASIKSGKRLPKGTDFACEETEFKYIRGRDIKNGKINTAELVCIDESVRDKIKKYIIQEGDIALTIVANIGDVGYCEAECNNYNLTENAVRLTNFKKDIVNPRYLCYYLSQPELKTYMENVSAGAAQSKLGIYKIEKLKVELPPIECQNAIVRVIKIYDDLIENNNKRIKILSDSIDEIYKEWFVRFRFPEYENAIFLNGIPNNWKIKKVKECVSRKSFGLTYKKEDLDNSGNVIVIDQSREEYLGFTYDEPQHKASAESPILLFGDHSCKKKLMIEDFSLGENVIPYTSIDNNNVNNYFLFYATKNLIQTEEYKRHWSRFCGFKIIVPDIEIQKKFSLIAKDINIDINKLWYKNQNLLNQRNMILSRLMSGKLTIDWK